MTKSKTPKLTKFELEVMDALWLSGRASVREIQERLPTGKRPAYTTVQTIVYRLEEKGALRRTKKIGNAHIFEPLISRQAFHLRLIDDLLDFFGGSAAPLMAHLVETRKLTLADLRRAEDVLAGVEGEAHEEATGRNKRRRRERDGGGR